ncbi:MAG: DUF4402 domain-containing protein [Alphaproteobacteria bacterium]|nr:DUF4402 domain-containing protein [Alphaproteobacteria bacterium]MBN2780048.1 DUF4402 domain-containing protein [Alphaproteobacteria bacterium]
MKYLYILITGMTLSTNVFAATGSGHAQAELSNPLSVSFPANINFGSISIDPGAGAQTITISTTSTVTCPSTYVCTGPASRAIVRVMGMPGALINIDMSGSIATLSDGTGNTLIFDPVLSNGEDAWPPLSINPDGSQQWAIGGSIDFTGNEVAGTYSSQNTGGSGFTVTINY